MVQNKADNRKILKELITKQIKDVPVDRKLRYKDLCRISKYIESSIFDDDECCIWNGYVTNIRNSKKGTYVNFYFKNRKVALHRLLYENFIGELDESEYLKFNCSHKGSCCNVNHMIKYKYNLDNECETSITKHTDKEKLTNPNDFIITFD